LKLARIAAKGGAAVDLIMRDAAPAVKMSGSRMTSGD
jgi:hypothetical protein